MKKKFGAEVNQALLSAYLSSYLTVRCIIQSGFTGRPSPLADSEVIVTTSG